MGEIQQAQQALQEQSQQIEQARQTTQQQQQQVQQYLANIPKTTAQQLLQASQQGQPLQGQLREVKISQMKGQGIEAQKELGAREVSIKEAEQQLEANKQQLESYLKTDTGKLQYAKETNAPVTRYEYRRIASGYALKEVPVYSTPYGEVVDEQMWNDYVRGQQKADARAMGFKNVSDMQTSLGYAKSQGANVFVTETGKSIPLNEAGTKQLQEQLNQDIASNISIPELKEKYGFSGQDVLNISQELAKQKINLAPLPSELIQQQVAIQQPTLEIARTIDYGGKTLYLQPKETRAITMADTQRVTISNYPEQSIAVYGTQPAPTQFETFLTKNLPASTLKSLSTMVDQRLDKSKAITTVTSYLGTKAYQKAMPIIKPIIVSELGKVGKDITQQAELGRAIGGIAVQGLSKVYEITRPYITPTLVSAYTSQLQDIGRKVETGKFIAGGVSYLGTKAYEVAKPIVTQAGVNYLRDTGKELGKVETTKAIVSYLTTKEVPVIDLKTGEYRLERQNIIKENILKPIAYYGYQKPKEYGLRILGFQEGEAPTLKEVSMRGLEAPLVIGQGVKYIGGIVGETGTKGYNIITSKISNTRPTKFRPDTSSDFLTGYEGVDIPIRTRTYQVGFLPPVKPELGKSIGEFGTYFLPYGVGMGVLASDIGIGYKQSRETGQPFTEFLGQNALPIAVGGLVLGSAGAKLATPFLKTSIGLTGRELSTFEALAKERKYTPEFYNLRTKATAYLEKSQGTRTAQQFLRKFDDTIQVSGAKSKAISEILNIEPMNKVRISRQGYEDIIRRQAGEMKRVEMIGKLDESLAKLKTAYQATTGEKFPIKTTSTLYNEDTGMIKLLGTSTKGSGEIFKGMKLNELRAISENMALRTKPEAISFIKDKGLAIMQQQYQRPAYLPSLEGLGFAGMERGPIITSGTLQRTFKMGERTKGFGATKIISTSTGKPIYLRMFVREGEGKVTTFDIAEPRKGRPITERVPIYSSTGERMSDIIVTSRKPLTRVGVEDVYVGKVKSVNEQLRKVLIEKGLTPMEAKVAVPKLLELRKYNPIYFQRVISKKGIAWEELGITPKGPRLRTIKTSVIDLTRRGLPSKAILEADVNIMREGLRAKKTLGITQPFNFISKEVPYIKPSFTVRVVKGDRGYTSFQGGGKRSSPEYFKKLYEEKPKQIEETIVYHGTTASSAEKIKAEGFIPGKEYRGIANKPKEIFLTTSKEAAEGYANRAAMRARMTGAKETPEVLQIKIPKAKLEEAIKAQGGIGRLGEVKVKEVRANQIILETPKPKTIISSEEIMPIPTQSINKKALFGVGKAPKTKAVEIIFKSKPEVITGSAYAGLGIYELTKTDLGIKPRVGIRELDRLLTKDIIKGAILTKDMVKVKEQIKVQEQLKEKDMIKNQEKINEKLNTQLQTKLQTQLQQKVQVSPKVETKIAYPPRPEPPRRPEIKEPFKFRLPRGTIQEAKLRKLPKIKGKPKGYQLEIRRRGKFIPVETLATPEQAEALGIKRTLKTAAASFRVKEVGKEGKSIDISISPMERRLFAPAKREAGVQVQKKLFRILSPGEKQETSYAGGFARSKGFGSKISMGIKSKAWRGIII